MPRQIRLNLNLQTAGRHDAAWKGLGDTRELVTDVDYYVIASLDHVSHGRAAWNIITSQNPPTLDALGLQDALDNDTRYGKAQEFVEILTGLWDSLPRSAIVDDPEHDIYIDESRTLPVDYQGEYYRQRRLPRQHRRADRGT